MTRRCKSKVTLQGKTAIVTGGNAGIGYETALDLARRGARVIIACRSKERAEEARERINSTTGNDNVIVKIVDLASFESVRNFAIDINKTEVQLDILINNAGVAELDDKRTVDGLQVTMQINYFGPFLLTILLLDLLKKTPSSRIVNVSSIGATLAGKLDVDTITEYPGSLKIYGISKLCNILFTIELAKRLEGTSVTTNSLDPGSVQTNIFKKLPPLLRIPMQTMSKLFYVSAEAGAQTSIYLAVDEEVANVSGQHFAECKQVKRYKTAQDPELPEKLWIATEKILHLNTS